MTSRRSHIRRIILVSVALLPLGYVGAYFAVLALPASVRIPWFPTNRPNDIQPSYIEISGHWNRYPDFHGLPDWLFAPIHDYDRIHLRPNLWSGSHPRNEELSFDWLLGKTATLPPDANNPALERTALPR